MTFLFALVRAPTLSSENVVGIYKIHLTIWDLTHPLSLLCEDLVGVCAVSGIVATPRRF